MQRNADVVMQMFLSVSSDAPADRSVTEMLYHSGGASADIDGSCLYDTQGGSKGEIIMTSTEIYAGASTWPAIQKQHLQMVICSGVHDTEG